ncbi:hypothetical protein CYMTET_44347 [Cymbomonas tetramitiformis]|uniref:Methyltransferase domain-containing protein n=1 Tax=Cymbomonas tetramitiformis TaxID=36881 RepID=A0AAE0EZ52_9CHLO|nr:hypothetical protein CYMTET_44347 [Cymbomonas tetramitiformis]
MPLETSVPERNPDSPDSNAQGDPSPIKHVSVEVKAAARICCHSDCGRTVARSGYCWRHYKCDSRSKQARIIEKARATKKAREIRTKERKRKRVHVAKPAPVTNYAMQGMTQERKSKLAALHSNISKRPECHETVWEEVDLLCRCVRLSGVGFDPCAGTGSIGRFVSEICPKVREVDGADIDRRRKGNVDFLQDALRMRLKEGCYDFIIFSPPFLLSDVFLMWAFEQPVNIWCFHLAGDYFTNAPAYRLRALKNKMDEGLVLFVSGLPVVKGRPMRRCLWIVIFANASVMRKHLIQTACSRVYMNTVMDDECRHKGEAP